MLGGGVISLIKELPMMITSFRDALKGYGQKATQVLRTDADMDQVAHCWHSCTNHLHGIVASNSRGMARCGSGRDFRLFLRHSQL